MFNIKIKSVPNKAKTGSQLDYSLVDRNTLFLKPNAPVDSDIKNTMGAVPRDEANIEAEGGETVVGDINNDGYLEHQTIVGKRHTKGGVPLNVPAGSFIFSDTDKLRIKDEEVLAIFGMKPSKKGYTPAEIAKKYQINDYIAILKDPKKDNYSKETAQIMLDSNMKKLGMLALVQESMKGFPDGLPAIAESVVAGMQGGEGMMAPGQEQGEGAEQEMMEGSEEPQEQEMRWGGGYYQKAGTTKEKQKKKQKVLPKKKEEGFWDNRVMPTWGQVGSAIFDTGPSAETYLATGINSLVHTGSWNGDGEKDAEGFAYGAKYMLPSELPQNAKLSKAKKVLLDAAADPLNQFFIAKGLATIATKAIAGAAAKEVANLSARHAARNTVKKEVSEELAKTVVKEAGKKITPRNIEIAKGAISKAAQNASKADFAGGARVGARNAMITYDATAAAKVAKAPFGYAYDKAGNLIKIIKNTPVKQIPGQIKNAIVKGAGATADVIMNSAKSDFIIPTINTLGIAYRSSGDEDDEAVNQQPVRVANPDETVPTALTTVTAVTDSIQQSAAPAPVQQPAQEVRQRIVYYDPRQAKPEDTPDVRYVPAQNSVQIKNPNLHNEEQYMINGEAVEYDPNFAYGGYYAGGGSYDNVDGDPPTKFVVGKDGKIGVRGADGKVAQTEFTKYLKYDKSVHGGKGGFRLELPSNISFKERQNIANLASQNGFGNIVQSSNQRIDKNNPYQGFYAGLRPEDFEDKIVRENFGDDAADKMSDIDKRKQAFKILNINVDDSKLADSKTLYNKDFIKNTFYPAFTKLLPESKYRPEMGNDAMFGLEHLDAYKIPKKPNKEIAKDNFNFRTPQRPVIGKRRFDPGWYAQDRINYAGTLGDRVDKYNPAMANYNFKTPDYALENPARMIAAIQEKNSKYNEMLSNSTAGNVAGATAASNFGEDLGAIANVIGTVENRNVGTYNNASVQGTQIANQNEIYDQNAKQKYIEEQATANQQYANARNQLKWRQIGALNNGLTNWMAKKQMEQVLFPQYNINPMTGDVNFTGERQMFNNDMSGFAVDTYQNPMYAGSNAGNIDVPRLYNDYIEQGYDDVRANNLINLQLKAMQVRSRGRNPYSDGYGSAYNAGRTLPMPFNQQQQQAGYGAYAASPYSMYDDYEV